MKDLHFRKNFEVRSISLEDWSFKIYKKNRNTVKMQVLNIIITVTLFR